MKRKKILYIAVSIITASLASSCNKLDLTPHDRTTDVDYWNNPESALYMVNKCYQGLNNAFEVLYSDAMTDNAYTKVTNNYNQYIGNGTYSTADSYVHSVWSNRYAGIHQCNQLLNNIDKVPNLSQELKDRYRGEAMFIRAYHYFELYSKFGDVPYFTHVISIEDSRTISRTAKQVVLENVLKDLEEIISNNYLPINYDAQNKGRITRWAAMSLKARVLLFEGNENASEILALTDRIINEG